MTAPAVVAPPARWLWAYRLLGLRVPEEHRAWVAQDLASDQGFRRLLAWRMLPLVVLALLLGLDLVARGKSPLSTLLVLLATVVASRYNLGYKRRKTLRFQRVDATGQPVPPEGLGRLSNAMATALALAAAAVFAALLLVLRGA